MTSHEILRADLLDIVFDNRNKEYGAYTLRKFYNNRLGIALGGALGSLLLVFGLSRLSSTHEAVVTNNEGVIVKTVVLPAEKLPVEKPKLPKATQAAQPTTQKAISNHFKLVNHDPLPLPDMDDLNKLPLASVASVGPGGPGPIVPHEPVTGTVVTGPPATATPPPALVQREPEFPGGSKAWLDFLRRNLRAPGELEAGEKKTVLIRFLVSAEGVVTGFEVMQSGGSDYDEEVMRVLRRMPKWKPALVNSQPVSRSFTQPVTFVGQEE
jgi:protein TonB